jgi:hypothetical protein
MRTSHQTWLAPHWAKASILQMLANVHYTKQEVAPKNIKIFESINQSSHICNSKKKIS